jgi:hypothetical protein
MDKHSFIFKNKLYQLTDLWGVTDHYQFDTIEQGKDFQMEQFNYLLKIKDYLTIENRIVNQIMLGYLRKSSYIK